MEKTAATLFAASLIEQAQICATRAARTAG
jgi:hypothetical protein